MHCPGAPSHYIAEEDNLSYTEFKLIPWQSIWAKMSEEYYENTIEYNFSIFENRKENFDVAVEFLKEKRKKWNMKIDNKRPAFVGTHIHIFDERFIRKNRAKMLEWVLAFIVDNMWCLSTLALERVLQAHQLWGCWSHRNNHLWVNFMSDRGLRVDHYEQSEQRPKYMPIIKSPATERGKPLSLEIRIIPNEFMFNWLAHKLMSLIENDEINEKRISAETFFITVYEEIKRRKKMSWERIEQAYVGNITTSLEEAVRRMREERYSYRTSIPNPYFTWGIFDEANSVMDEIQPSRDWGIIDILDFTELGIIPDSVPYVVAEKVRHISGLMSSFKYAYWVWVDTRILLWTWINFYIDAETWWAARL